MASDLEQKAKEAFIDDHFELALELYNQAIDLNPNYAELYADRAQANIKLNNLTGNIGMPIFSTVLFLFILLLVILFLAKIYHCSLKV